MIAPPPDRVSAGVFPRLSLSPVSTVFGAEELLLAAHQVDPSRWHHPNPIAKLAPDRIPRGRGGQAGYPGLGVESSVAPQHQCGSISQHASPLSRSRGSGPVLAGE
jgi:hypothetical protein